MFSLLKVLSISYLEQFRKGIKKIAGYCISHQAEIMLEINPVSDI